MDEMQTVNLSEQEAIRREKLAALQAAGKDPFRITRFDQNWKARRSASRGA